MSPGQEVHPGSRREDLGLRGHTVCSGERQTRLTPGSASPTAASGNPAPAILASRPQTRSQPVPCVCSDPCGVSVTQPVSVSSAGTAHRGSSQRVRAAPMSRWPALGPGLAETQSQPLVPLSRSSAESHRLTVPDGFRGHQRRAGACGQRSAGNAAPLHGRSAEARHSKKLVCRLIETPGESIYTGLQNSSTVHETHEAKFLINSFYYRNRYLYYICVGTLMLVNCESDRRD